MYCELLEVFSIFLFVLVETEREHESKKIGVVEEDERDPIFSPINWTQSNIKVRQLGRNFRFRWKNENFQNLTIVTIVAAEDKFERN